MKKINSRKINKVIQFVSLGVFVVCALYLGYELVLRPYLSEKAVTEARNLHNISKEETADVKEPESTNAPTDTVKETADPDTSKDSPYDSLGRLKEFSALLSANEDVKGWLTIDGTNIDYPVLQSGKDDPEYYLHRNIDRKTDKAGSLFLDVNSSVEENTKNMVIYGHNMKSTDNMFHYLIKYNDLSYYREHPVITFNTLYQKGQWKIISILKADADINDDFFDFTRASFQNDEDFLEYIYQLRIRSIYNIPVDINEKDQIITLVTCSYELNNYRTVIVAKKIRDGEPSAVDVKKAVTNPSILYPPNWYANYGGTAPKTSSFKEALEAGQIDWYIKP